MPKLNDISKAQRVDKALQVMALMTANPKMTQKSACTQVGIDPDVYRYWVTQNEDAIETFREAIREVERMEMASILIAKESILNQVIADGLNKMTDPATRLGIHAYLSNRLDDLAERQRTITHSVAKEVLGGPQLEQGENRFGMSQAPLLNIETNADGSVDIHVKQRQVIDGVTIDPFNP
jgi:hypothetical protein